MELNTTVSHFISVMSLIKEKPALYIGKKSFTMLDGFIAGFSHAEFLYNLSQKETKLFPLPFHFFHEFVKNKLGYFESTSGWSNMIFETNNQDEEKSFDAFFELYEHFIHLKIQSCASAILSEENKHFHIHDPSGPKRVIGCDEQGNLVCAPYFSEPEQVFLIRLSHNAGYLRVTLTKKECLLEFHLRKSKKESIAFFHQCFGANLNWTKEKWKDELLNNRKIT